MRTARGHRAGTGARGAVTGTDENDTGESARNTRGAVWVGSGLAATWRDASPSAGLQVPATVRRGAGPRSTGESGVWPLNSRRNCAMPLPRLTTGRDENPAPDSRA